MSYTPIDLSQPNKLAEIVNSMKIQVDDTFCKIIEPRSHMPAVALVRSVCRARPDGYQYMPRYRAGVWDGYISVMRNGSLIEFPTGLLPTVMDVLKNNGYNVELDDNRQPKPFKPVVVDVLKGVTLRDYQQEAAMALLRAGRGVAAMATNSGKTEVMAAIAWALGCDGVLIIVNGKELLYQGADRFAKRLAIDVGIIGDGVWEPKPITVATVQTLSNHPNLPEFAENACVMVDECHHTSSDTFIDILSRVPGYYRFGFSGTPLKYDALSDMKLMAHTGPVVYTISNKQMIKYGYSAKPTIKLIYIDDVDDKVWDMGYQDAYDAAIVNNDIRNKRIALEASKAMETGIVLILVNRIKHGKVLNKLLSNAKFLHGSLDMSKRNGALDEMRQAGAKGMYIATPIFDEGVDVPAVDTIIMAGGGLSHIKLLQRIGRGMRMKPGQNTLDVIDFIDTGNEYLLNHTEARLNVYSDEGFYIRKES